MKVPQSEKTRRMRPLLVEVARVERLAPHITRVVFAGASSFNMRGMERPHADTQSYLKRGGTHHSDDNRGHDVE